MENNETQVSENTTETVESPKVDHETELAKLMAEVKKLKATADKNASEAAEFKKKWRATLDENEQARVAKEEEDRALREELETLRRDRDMSNMEKNFLGLGYSADLAKRAAQAQIDGDTNALFDVQKQFVEQITKNIRAEQVSNMPTPPVSNDSETSVTQEQFDKMTISEQVELKNKNPELFKKFTQI